MSKLNHQPHPFTLEPVRRQTLAETVVEQILAEVKQRGLKPGTRMPSERELQRLLGVGRSTVREAMTGLSALGVVEIRHGEGAFVTGDPAVLGATDEIATALSKGVTRVLLEARRPIETEVARLAALRRTDSDLKALRAILEEHEDLMAGHQSAARQAAQFHLVLADAAHNEVLAGFVASYRRLLVDRGPRLEQIEGYRAWELDGHQRLFSAVEAGDPQLATTLMQEHLDKVVGYYAEIGWPL